MAKVGRGDRLTGLKASLPRRPPTTACRIATQVGALVANGSIRFADSTGQRNTLAEHFSRGLISKSLSRSLVQLSGDGIELGLRVGRDVDALGQVLP